MQIRNFVSFKSPYFVDEYQEFIDGGLFAGQALSEYLVQQMNNKGFTAEPPEMEDFAWTLYVQVDGSTFWIHVGESGNSENEWLVTVNTTLGFLRRLLGKTDDVQIKRFCWDLHQILAADTRVSEIAWHSETEWSQAVSISFPTPE